MPCCDENRRHGETCGRKPCSWLRAFSKWSARSVNRRLLRGTAGPRLWRSRTRVQPNRRNTRRPRLSARSSPPPRRRVSYRQTHPGDGLRRIARVVKHAGAPANVSAGVKLLRTVGDVVAEGEPFFEIHAQSAAQLVPMPKRTPTSCASGSERRSHTKVAHRRGGSTVGPDTGVQASACWGVGISLFVLL